MTMNANPNVITSRNDFIACAYLFSPEHARKHNFLKNLEISTVKKAFREKAKRYHPDLHIKDNDEIIAKRQERFIKIKKSYEYLFIKLQKKETVLRKETHSKSKKRPRIIAIGGAKGGIGKSILASNLSVYLARKGFSTVAADLDLGGANLHLFLGKPILKKSINNYLTNDVANLTDIMETSKYGPRLIGGNSSQLGAANLSFTRKLKLLRAIRNIDADYVIMDLGGDTSYNVIDFFLAADIGIVMTTCDPASYLDAYSFIKVALFRKLSRLHGPESMVAGKIDQNLKKLISETIMSKSNPKVGDIEELIRRIRIDCPHSLKTIKKVFSDFNPQLIVNKVTNEKEALGPIKRIQEVAKKKLSIRVKHLCSMPFQKEIQHSARTLIPWISNVSDRKVIQKIDVIAAKLMNTNPTPN